MAAPPATIAAASRILVSLRSLAAADAAATPRGQQRFTAVLTDPNDPCARVFLTRGPPLLQTRRTEAWALCRFVLLPNRAAGVFDLGHDGERWLWEDLRLVSARSFDSYGEVDPSSVGDAQRVWPLVTALSTLVPAAGLATARGRERFLAMRADPVRFACASVVTSWDTGVSARARGDRALCAFASSSDGATAVVELRSVDGAWLLDDIRLVGAAEYTSFGEPDDAGPARLVERACVACRATFAVHASAHVGYCLECGTQNTWTLT